MIVKFGEKFLVVDEQSREVLGEPFESEKAARAWAKAAITPKGPAFKLTLSSIVSRCLPNPAGRVFIGTR